MDPFLSLGLGVRATKGGYAVLLGSGISRAAGIPTGWEVILDLIRQLAAVRGEACEPDPAAWFQSQFNQQPDYAQLVEAVAGTQTERRQLLRRYFEPTPEEREQGLKLPTRAHRAVAELMQHGYVRVVVTTNFDHLLEDALAALGVNATVVSTADATEGVMPLVHVEHLIIKVHGDYLDTRIKNTPDELAAYDPRLNRLLDRVLDEFGLIVCGWSAEWDEALRGAIERCTTHRFMTYWSVLNQPTEVANRLIQLRRAQIVPGFTADELFSRLFQSISALEEVSRAHPLSPKVAVATLKRYLPDARHTIALHDLVMGEARAVQQCNAPGPLDT